MGGKQYYNLFMVSFGFMLVFTAFQTVGNLEVAVLNAVHEDDPNFNGDAKTSLAIIYLVFAFFNWLVPPIIDLIGPRIGMIIGAAGYLGMTVQFLYPMEWLLYLMSVLVGMMAAIIWTAEGNYMTLNAGKEKIALHSGIFWAILQCSMVIGNTFVFFKFNNIKTIDSTTRYVTFIVLSAICGAGLVLLCVLQKPQRPDGEVVVDEKVGPWRAFLNSFRLMKNPLMSPLPIMFLFTGLELSFWSGIYSSAIGATEKLPNSKALIGLSGIFLGLGEITGGFIFGILGKYTAKKGRHIIVLIALGLALVTYSLIVINIPNDASSQTSTQSESVIYPNQYLAITCSLLLGLTDAMFNTQVYASLGILFEQESVYAFTIFKFFQSFGAAAAFFYSSWIGLRLQLLIVAIFGIVGCSLYTVSEIRYSKKIED